MQSEKTGLSFAGRKDGWGEESNLQLAVILFLADCCCNRTSGGLVQSWGSACVSAASLGIYLTGPWWKIRPLQSWELRIDLKLGHRCASALLNPWVFSRAFTWTQNHQKSQSWHRLENGALLKALCSFLPKRAPSDSSSPYHTTILIHQIPACPHYPSIYFLPSLWHKTPSNSCRSQWKGDPREEEMTLQLASVYPKESL